jgi:hypothetical protein
MRDLLFKNLSSTDRKKRVLVSMEVSENDGVRTYISRHLICVAREIQPEDKIAQPLPGLYVRKERNSKEQRERFFMRMKGSICTVFENHIYQITFLHSLKINITAVSAKPIET